MHSAIIRKISNVVKCVLEESTLAYDTRVKISSRIITTGDPACHTVLLVRIITEPCYSCSSRDSNICGSVMFGTGLIRAVWDIYHMRSAHLLCKGGIHAAKANQSGNQ